MGVLQVRREAIIDFGSVFRNDEAGNIDNGWSAASFWSHFLFWTSFPKRKLGKKSKMGMPQLQKFAPKPKMGALQLRESRPK